MLRKEKQICWLQHMQNNIKSRHKQCKRGQYRNSDPKSQVYLVKPKIFQNAQNLFSYKTYALSLVSLSKDSLLDSLDIYEWRQKTEYPIIKAFWSGIALNKTQGIIRNKKQLKPFLQNIFNKNQNFCVEVQTQRIEPISTNTVLSISSFLYAMKQSLIGFERLFALFGGFSISHRNIGVNQEGKVKVWISAHFDQNTKMEIPKFLSSQKYMAQKYVVSQIKEVFFGLSPNTFIYRSLFSTLKTASKFIQVLKALEDFVLVQKILIPKRITKLSQKMKKRCNSPKINVSDVKLYNSNKLLSRATLENIKRTKDWIFNEEKPFDKSLAKQKYEEDSTPSSIDQGTNKFSNVKNFSLEDQFNFLFDDSHQNESHDKSCMIPRRQLNELGREVSGSTELGPTT